VITPRFVRRYKLQGLKVNAGRNNIIYAVAQKCEVFCPGVYHAELYEEPKGYWLRDH
jgi:hypothetical protein